MLCKAIVKASEKRKKKEKIFFEHFYNFLWIFTFESLEWSLTANRVMIFMRSWIMKNKALFHQSKALTFPKHRRNQNTLWHILKPGLAGFWDPTPSSRGSWIEPARKLVPHLTYMFVQLVLLAGAGWTLIHGMKNPCNWSNNVTLIQGLFELLQIDSCYNSRSNSMCKSSTSTQDLNGSGNATSIAMIFSDQPAVPCLPIKMSSPTLTHEMTLSLWPCQTLFCRWAVEQRLNYLLLVIIHLEALVMADIAVQCNNATTMGPFISHHKLEEQEHWADFRSWSESRAHAMKCAAFVISWVTAHHKMIELFIWLHSTSNDYITTHDNLGLWFK